MTSHAVKGLLYVADTYGKTLKVISPGGTIYLVRAVQRIDPTNLLLAQALIGSAGLAAVSLWLEGGIPYRWTTSLALAPSPGSFSPHPSSASSSPGRSPASHSLERSSSRVSS